MAAPALRRRRRRRCRTGAGRRAPGRGSDTSPPRGTVMPASRRKYSGGAIRLYGSSPATARRTDGSARRAGAGSGRSPTSSVQRVGGQREVGLDDARVLAGLVVHGPGQAHHARALLAREVGDARLAVGVDAERVDQPQVGLLDRLDHFTGRRLELCRGQRLGELPVGVRAAGAAGLDQQVARPLGQQRPQRRQLAGLVDVDPQEAAVRDRVLVAAAVGARRDADERLLARPGARSPVA